MKQPETLQDYVIRIARLKGLSHVKIAERAKAKGLKLSSGYVSNIMNGYATNLTVSLVQALAVGLGEPEDDVFAVVRGLTTQGFNESTLHAIWRDMQSLPNGEQRHFKRSLEMLHREMRRILSS